MKKYTVLCAGLCLAMAMTSCKTSESAYKKAYEKGQDTRVKITDAVEDFLKKHNIKLSRKEVVDLVDDIQDAAAEEE